MSGPEFSRSFDVRQSSGKAVTLSAGDEERAALAARFGLVRIDRLEAAVLLERTGEAVEATGRLDAEIVQSCAVSGEDLPVSISEPLSLRFVPAGTVPATTEEEVELDPDARDEIEYVGARFDLGEAVSQSLALAVDPFSTGPGADEMRRKAGLQSEGDAGPFGALRGLLKD